MKRLLRIAGVPPAAQSAVSEAMASVLRVVQAGSHSRAFHLHKELAFNVVLAFGRILLGLWVSHHHAHIERVDVDVQVRHRVCRQDQGQPW